MASQQDAADVAAVLERRHDNGADYWATPDGRIGTGAPFSTLESLVTLHELKVPKTHEAVRGALDAVLQAGREDGRFRVSPKGAIYPCHTAWAARVLCRYGYANSRLLRPTLRELESKLDDRGRVIVEHPNRRLAKFALCEQGQPSQRATARYREILDNLGSKP